MRNGILAALILAWTGALAGQTNGPGATPKTPWGDPDLQGTWSSEAELGVPLERSLEFGTRQFLTEAEFAQRQARAEKQAQSDLSEFEVFTADTRNAGAVGSATSPPPHWLERGKVSRRTSIVVDPPDGRLPPRVQGRQPRTRRPGDEGTSVANAAFNGPEDMSLWVRCITRGGVVPDAIFPAVYNANVRIVQSPDAVAVTYEMVHDTRVIPLDRRPHAGSAIRGYQGDARGHWEGNTLVVETTNFKAQSTFRGASSDALLLTERFTRENAGIRYEAVVNDPTTWTRPWTAALTLAPQPDDALFEYGCHEGNNAMRNILSGARAAEKQGK
jgi:hypothetical protein